MEFASHLTKPDPLQPERNRYVQRMNAIHPCGWSVHYPSINRDNPPTDEEIFAEFNRIQDMDEQGMLKRYTNFNDIPAAKGELLSSTP